MFQIKFIPFIFLVILFSSCSDSSVNNSYENLPDFEAIFFENENNNNNQKIGGPAPPTFRTQSTLISADSGCYTINVQVILIDGSGTEWLAASNNVQIGDCSKSKSASHSVCIGGLPDGGYVFEDGISAHLCLYEVLTRNETAYAQYEESIKKLIADYLDKN